VYLKLHPNVQTTRQQPGGQVNWFNQTERRAQQHRDTFVEVMGVYDVRRPVEVVPRRDHKLDLIRRLESIQVSPTVILALATIRTLQIHNDVDTPIDGSDVMGAAGLQKDSASRVRHLSHERENVRLQERLPAGDFNQRTLQTKDLG
jgi:hypothetical protein